MNARAMPFGGILTTASLFFLAPLSGQNLHYSELLRDSATASRIKGFDKPEPVEALKTYPGYEYEYVQRLVDEKGELVDWNWGGTSRWLERYMHEHFSDIRVAKPAKGTTGYDWLEVAVIFNPKGAGTEGANRQPRLEKIFLPKVTETEAQTMPGNLEVELQLEADGRVVEARALTESDPQFTSRALEAVKHWIFSPARKEGVAVKANVTVPVCFGIDHQSYDGLLKPDRGLQPHADNARPVYPVGWKRSGIGARVTVEYIVEKNGSVSSAKVVSTDNPGFIDSALEAVLSWKFKPGLKNGKPVRARVEQVIQFMLYGETHDAFEFTLRGNVENLPEELRYDTAAKVIDASTPVYPRDAYLSKKSGTAKVKAVVSPDGAIRVSVIEASAPEFKDAAQAAIDSLRFTPASMKGKPVNFLFGMTFDFDNSVLSSDDLRIGKLLRKGGAGIHEASELDAKPKVKYTVAPKYPVRLLDKGFAGNAKVEIIVDEDGLVHWPKVVNATDPAFGAAAVQAVSLWKFEPAKIKGEKAIWRAVVPFAFDVVEKKEKTKDDQKP